MSSMTGRWGKVNSLTIMEFFDNEISHLANFKSILFATKQYQSACNTEFQILKMIIIKIIMDIDPGPVAQPGSASGF